MYYPGHLKWWCLDSDLQGTMPAKSLGTFAMIYAIGELQIPPPPPQCCVKQSCVKEYMNTSRSDTFLQR